MENGPSEAGADDEVEETQPRKVSPSEPGSTAEAQAAEHEAEVTGVRSTATDTGTYNMSIDIIWLHCHC